MIFFNPAQASLLTISYEKDAQLKEVHLAIDKYLKIPRSLILKIRTHKPCSYRSATPIHWCLNNKGELILKKNDMEVWNKELKAFRN